MEGVSYVKPIPSQANYIMCEVTNGILSSELAVYLLKRNVLIKDLSHKINNGRQYIRLAVRCHDENEFLVRVLGDYMESRTI